LAVAKKGVAEPVEGHPFREDLNQYLL